eukprot:8950097-Pyramimonas_sp.AAC.1
MQILFVGEWDGTLSTARVLQVLRRLRESTSRPSRALVSPCRERVFAKKCLGGQSSASNAYTYKEYYFYAKDHRIQQIMDRYLAQGADGTLLTDAWVQQVQPHACINAAMMWYHAEFALRATSFHDGATADSDD